MNYKTGDIIKIKVLQNEEPSDLLCRSPSTYGYGFNLQLKPIQDTQYVVCQGDYRNGYTLMEYNNQKTPIGFIILTRDNKDYYRISQVGFEPIPICITVIDKYEGEIPKQTMIGSQVFVVRAI
jgi:hypothetical protein